VDILLIKRSGQNEVPLTIPQYRGITDKIVLIWRLTIRHGTDQKQSEPILAWFASVLLLFVENERC